MAVHPVSEASFQHLIEVMEHFFVLGTRFKQALRPLLLETVYGRGSRILNAREVQRIVWFMLEGLVREIRVEPLSFAERTSWFWRGEGFLYTEPGFFSQEPSGRTIEVLEDSRMVFISYEHWKELVVGFSGTMDVTERIRGENARLRLLHAGELGQLGVDERYLNNESMLQDLCGRTKLKYVAEFMGMAPDTLSRLRKKYSGRR